MTILENADIKYLRWSLFRSRSLQLYHKMDSTTDVFQNFAINEQFGWFWVVLGGFGWLWIVLAGFGWLHVL